MAPHTPRSKAYLEIIPETRFIVFNGDEHSADPVTLAGVVRFHTPDSMSIKTPKIWLEGKRRISWYYMGGMAAGEVSDKRQFFLEKKELGYTGTHKINKGIIEWPFEFTLDPGMAESIEGMTSTWVTYNLHASISRPGWNAKDITASTHVRLVRTLGADQMETTRSRTNSDVWANKLSYSISIPTDAIVFGTSITADVELVPIRKGVTFGKVEMRLVEAITKRIQHSEVPDLRCDRSKTDESEVAKAEMEFPEHSRMTFDDESADDPVMEDEKYVFKATLPLPKSLKECRQDVDSHAINITHRFKLMVNIHNPEGHVSQLVCRLPVKLFISPNLPVDEQNMVQAGAVNMTDAELNANEFNQNAPPEYGRHQLDELYSDLNANELVSRNPSGANTPFFAQSRRASVENLHAMTGLANLGASTADDQVNSALLQARLASLQNQGSNRSSRIFHHSPSGGTTPHNGIDIDLPHRGTPPTASSYFSSHFSSNGHSPAQSIPQSRRNSHDFNSAPGSAPNGHVDFSLHDYDMNDLSRVPSYNAAVRTPGPRTPFFDGPPSYIDATSRPPSPVHGAGIQRPGVAHVRASGTSTPNSTSSQTTLMPSSGAPAAGFAATGGALQLQQAHAHAHPHGVHGVSQHHAHHHHPALHPRGHADEDHRLRMLRAGRG